MYELHNSTIQCPYCWEMIEILVDCSVESQQYIEDCQVCCRPINIAVTMKGDLPIVEVSSDDE